MLRVITGIRGKTLLNKEILLALLHDGWIMQADLRYAKHSQVSEGANSAHRARSTSHHDAPTLNFELRKPKKAPNVFEHFLVYFCGRFGFESRLATN